MAWKVVVDFDVCESNAICMGVAPEVFDPDDNTRVLQGMLLEVDEAYAHCPRAFTFSWSGRITARCTGCCVS